MKDYKTVLDALIRQDEVRIEYGVEVYVKSAPDLEQGRLDPRVLSEIKEKSGNNQTKIDTSLFADFQTAAKIALEMRKIFGSENTDISENIQIERVMTDTKYPVPILIYKEIFLETNAPVFIFFHGGGFIGGTTKVVENFCKLLAQYLRGVVISVEYHLSPEYAAPLAINEAFETVKWVYENDVILGVNKDKIAVGGDSAGANLATVAAIIDREVKTNYISFQTLIYPTLVMDQEGLIAYAWPIDKYGISKELEPMLQSSIDSMIASHELIETVYTRALDSKDIHLSPLYKKRKGKMPATLMAVAQFDGLRAYGMSYGQSLIEAGVNTKILCYDGMQHAFIDNVGLYPQAEDLAIEIAKMANDVWK